MIDCEQKRAAPDGAYKRFDAVKTLPQGEFISPEDFQSAPRAPDKSEIWRETALRQNGFPGLLGVGEMGNSSM